MHSSSATKNKWSRMYVLLAYLLGADEFSFPKLVINNGNKMGGQFAIFLQLAAFLGSAWLSGRFMRLFHCSPIIGEIIAGVIMGPELLNFFPYSQTHFQHEPSPFVLCGQVFPIFVLCFFDDF